MGNSVRQRQLNLAFALLIAATLGLAATTFYFARELSLEHQRTLAEQNERRRLQRQLSARESAEAHPDSNPSSIPPTPPRDESAPTASASKSRDAPPPSKDLATEMQRRARADRDARLRRLADPETRALMHGAALARLRQENFDLARALGLTTSQVEKLLKLLADQELRRGDIDMSGYGASPGNGYDASARNRERQELVAVLGEEDTRRYEGYRDAAPARNMTRWFRAQLDAADMLADDQTTRLIADLQDEKVQFEKDRAAQLNVVAGQPLARISAGYVGMLMSTASSPEEVYKQMEDQLLAYRQRMHDRAAGVLTQPQLEHFDAFLDLQLVDGRLAMRELRDRQSYQAESDRAPTQRVPK